MNEVFIDIETIPTQRQDVKEYVSKSIQHPATHKKPETIEKWYLEEGPAAAAEAIAKTGLDGAFGQVCVVGIAIGDGAPVGLFGLDEKALLNQVNATLNQIERSMWSATTLVGHNVLSFDIRFLLQRFIVNGVRPHPIINMAVNAKPWDGTVYDTMTQFAGHGNRISLDKLCLALNIKSPKGDMDGSMVGQAVADGRIEEVRDYCLRDVEATREVFKRMTFK